jgi:hypothetical protein
LPRNANDEKYKADQEAVPTAGKSLVVLYLKISIAFPLSGEAFLIKKKKQ